MNELALYSRRTIGGLFHAALIIGRNSLVRNGHGFTNVRFEFRKNTWSKTI